MGCDDEGRRGRKLLRWRAVEAVELVLDEAAFSLGIEDILRGLGDRERCELTDRLADLLEEAMSRWER